MLIISFDAVGDREFEQLMEYPAFSVFSGQAAVYRDVPTLFVSNTYPIHTSIATGVMPVKHGIIANTKPFPAKFPIWNVNESGIRAETIWQAAAKRGIETAAVFWPVTALSKTIRYNIPEVLARPGKSQIITSLKAGSKRLQLEMLIRHGKILSGINQPNIDNFATACMTDILRKYKPGLALIHLTAYDSLCHKHGKGSPVLKTAYESLDKNLARLLEAAGESEDVIIFSDHSQINLHTEILPNEILERAGLISREGDDWRLGESGCYIECCSGCAFFHAGQLPECSIEEIRINIEQSEGFRRFLTSEEMHNAGYQNAAFGFCAETGYCYEAFLNGNKADHGYPPDTPDYNVFYMVRGAGLPKGSVTRGGSLLDIAPLVASRLGLVTVKYD